MHLCSIIVELFLLHSWVYLQSNKHVINAKIRVKLALRHKMILIQVRIRLFFSLCHHFVANRWFITPHLWGKLDNLLFSCCLCNQHDVTCPFFLSRVRTLFAARYFSVRRGLPAWFALKKRNAQLREGTFVCLRQEEGKKKKQEKEVQKKHFWGEKKTQFGIIFLFFHLRRWSQKTL